MRKKNRRLLSALLGVCLATTMCVTSMSTWYEKPTAYGESVSTSRIDTSSKILEKVNGQYDDTEMVTSKFNDSVTVKDEEESEVQGTISVIVDLGGDGLYDIYDGNEKFSDFVTTFAANNYASELKKEQNKFMSALNRSGIDYEVKHYYNTVLNGVGLRIDASDYKKLSSISGVKGVYRSEFYYEPTVEQVSNYTPVYSTGVYDSSNIDYKGEGTVVAVLDTGLDAYHAAFQTIPPESTLAWDKEYVAERMSQLDSYALGYSVNDVYYSDKVPYAFDYADDDADVFPGYSSHGVHVAGIIAGKDDSKVVDAAGNTFIGVAPNAQLAIMKVFSNNFDKKGFGGADTLDILRALEDCTKLGVDVINMSLGSTGGFSDFESDERVTRVYENIENAGISLVVAAGNEYSSGFGGGNGTNLATNPDSGTVGSPGSYNTSFTVASIEGQKSPYILGNEGGNETVAFLTNSSDGNGNEINFIDKLYAAVSETDTTKSITLPYVVIGGVGKTMNYTASIRRQLQKEPTIALVKRGDISFADKIQFAKDNGAVACVIYNNLSGTIRMSLGELTDPIPACSIGLEAGTSLVNNAKSGKGTMTFSYGNTAGPFMSEFSSWGPTPSLELKPEITAYGGKILSAVAGGYDEYSGTSMATPNMAGMTAIVRQYLKEQDPTLTGAALNARVIQLLMSTTTMVLNNEGNPYSPRKQGAGLGFLENALYTKGYITVKDDAGNVKQKTKLELYDDPLRTGKYDLKFTVNNISDGTISYVPNLYTMTETIAVDGKTVAEKAHMLDDTGVQVEILGGSGRYENGRIVVDANSSVDVKIRLTLGDEGRAYIEKNFKNGMYVEGFVRLEQGKDNSGEEICDIGVPYLAFYGDWAAADLLDYTCYEISESENDSSVEPEDKLKASASATTPLGLYEDKYIIPLGTYIYSMDENDVAITASSDKAAISMFNKEDNSLYGSDAISELYYIYGGLLRGAKQLDTQIIDTSTGELVYKNTVYNQRKSYAGGGANVGSPIYLGINPYEWDWNNNTEYEFTMTGKIDWKDGKANNDTFKFNFTVDYEAPTITDYRVRYESYVENKKTKYDIYLDVDVYDNQYSMALMPAYIEDRTIYSITQYPIPIHSEKNSVTTVSFNITDYYEEYFKTGKLFLYPVDYAMNHSLYRVGYAEATDYPDRVKFETDNKLSFVTTGKAGSGDDAYEYDVYKITLAPNEVYKLNQITTPADTVAYKLTWTSSDDNSVIAYEDEIFALAEARQVLLELSANGRILAQVKVSVSGEAKAEPILQTFSFKPVVNGDRYVQAVNGSLKLRNSTQLQLEVETDPWYYQGLELTWSTSNADVVSVDQNGVITTHKQGRAFITATAKHNPLLAPSIDVTVISDFNVRSYTLYNYYGGEVCEIPEELNVMYLNEDCFKDNTTVKRIILPKTLTEIPENAFSGCTNLEYIYIPSSCVAIMQNAFSGCTSLKEIDLGKFENKRNDDDDDGNPTTGTLTVGRSAFANCTSLTTIKNPERLTGAFSNAFENCTSLESLDISGLRIAQSNLFAGCTNLTQVTMSSDTNLGAGIFANCTSLESIVIKSSKVPDMAFYGCTNLKNVTFEGSVDYIGTQAFGGCSSLTKITLPGGTYTLGEDAFGGCTNLSEVTFSQGTKLQGDIILPFKNCTSLQSIEVNENNENYTSVGGVLYDKQKTTVLLVPVLAAGYAIPDSVTKVGASAFAGNTNLTTIDLGRFEEIGAYAFAGTGLRNVTIPAVLTAIPDGMFANANQLLEVNFVTGIQLTKIGDYAFENCNMLSQVVLPETVTEIGDGAFLGCSAVRSIKLTNVQTIGSEAFSGTGISKITAKNTTTLKDGAFWGMSSLVQADLGAITEMGDLVFVETMLESNGSYYPRGLTKLSKVTFAEGTTVIGARAFMTALRSEFDSLTEVVIPNTVETIGANAFYGRSKLATLNLSGVKTVGDQAFYNCSSLKNLDLTSAETIGAAAFANTTALKVAEMPSLTKVGASAFQNSGIETLVLGSIEVIDSYAFANTKIKSLTIPSSLSSYTYDESWFEINTNGDPEEIKGKKTLRIMNGAFQNLVNLTKFDVESTNAAFFADENGALYARVADGYVLVQYPAGNTAEEYTVLDGTVRIADNAFYQDKHIKKITFPKTLKSIGSFAFYGAAVEDYVFNAVEAPILESLCMMLDMTYLGDLANTIAYVFSPVLGYESTIYYANFGDFAGLVLERDNYFSYLKRLEEAGSPVDKYKDYVMPEFKHKLTRPQNGEGYSTPIWLAYFSEENTTLTDYAADRTTQNAIDKINGISSADEINTEINGLSDVEAKLTKLAQISAELSVARTAYNEITDVNQRALVTEYSRLLASEKAVRDLKADLGQPVNVDRLERNGSYETLYTEGEKFDPKDMVITAVFEDGSSIVLTKDDYVLDKTGALTANDEKVTISYGGKQLELLIQVKANSQGDSSSDSNGSDSVITPDDKGCNGALAGTLIAVACVLAAAAVAVVLIKNKKGKKSNE